MYFLNKLASMMLEGSKMLSDQFHLRFFFLHRIMNPKISCYMKPSDFFISESQTPKTRFLIQTTMKDILGPYREHAYWLSNEIPLGHSEKSRITIRGLGHWLWDRSTDVCYRVCRTKLRTSQLTTKLNWYEINFKKKAFIA